MTNSSARLLLSRLIERHGTDGVLVVRKLAPGEDVRNAALVLNSPLHLPPCTCGHSLCPDASPPAPPDPPRADRP